jgi:flagellar protein FliT
MSQILSDYESLATLSGEMRKAASQGEWDKLIAQESEYSGLVAKINSSAEISTLDEKTRQRAVELIRLILADDNEIRNQTKNWMEQLQNIMQSNRQEQRLNQTYGAT